jgi:hypothetical protein
MFTNCKRQSSGDGLLKSSQNSGKRVKIKDRPITRENATNTAFGKWRLSR